APVVPEVASRELDVRGVVIVRGDLVQGPRGYGDPSPHLPGEDRSKRIDDSHLHSYVRDLWLRFWASGDELGPNFPDAPDLDHADRLRHGSGPDLRGIGGGDQDQRPSQHGPERGQLGLRLYSRDHPKIPAPGGSRAHEPAPHHPGGGGERPLHPPLEHSPDPEVHGAVGAVGPDQVLILRPLQTEGLGLRRWLRLSLELDKGHLLKRWLGGGRAQGPGAGASHRGDLRVGVRAGVGVVPVHRGHDRDEADIGGGAKARTNDAGVAVSVDSVAVARTGVGVSGQASARVPDVRLGPARVAPGQVRSAVVAVAQLPTVRDGVQGTAPYRDQSYREVRGAGVVLAYPEVAVRGVIWTLGA